ncbi:MAG TPA: ABC transporter permease [Blastocatellia bacterium]|nr:ABC transporter permease [Blastocatellia bacterium]
MMNTLTQDIRYGFRMLLKSPGFTLVAVIALALGIGVNTAIFSVVNTVLLRPLPYREPDRLLALQEQHAVKHSEMPVSPGNFVEWEKQNTTFEKLAAYRTTSHILTGIGEPQRLRGARVSAGTFTMLGINPLQGRDFMDEEDLPGKGNVALISHGLWQRLFGGNPNIMGQALTLDGNSFTVIGVMPQTLKFPDAETEIWVPTAFSEQERQARGAKMLSVIGRLKPGVTRGQAQAEMEAITARLAEQYPENSNFGAKITPLLEYAVGDLRPTLLVLLGAVLFVLLIACANVANLMLARAATRQKEIAIRTALGAGRGQIVRQLLTESLLLAMIGGGAGVLLAVWGVDALLALAPEDLPRINEVAIDGSTLAFTFALTLLTGLGFGLAPALQASKPDLNETLKDAGRGSSGGVHRARVRNALVVAEVALALVLLVGGGLLIRSFIQLQQVKPGFNTENALVVNMSLPQRKYPQGQQAVNFYDQLMRNLSTLPGVQAVGGSGVFPFVNEAVLGFYVQGEPRSAGGDMPTTNYFSVSPDYFRAMGIPLLKGRVFTETDRQDTTPVAVINETFAKRYFPDEDPIGKRIHVTNGPEVFREVVGVVGDVKQYGLARETNAQFYEPFAQQPRPGFTIVLRAGSDPTALSGAVRARVQELDKDQPVTSIQTVEEILRESVAQERFSMLLLGIFAALALVLAAVGLYGVISYSVTQRTHEIGIRMALGASRGDVLKLVIGQGMVMALAGVGIGLAGAFALTRLMSGMLFGVSATDPITFAVISMLLTGVALAASYLPARRALKVDPMVALRYE